MKINKNWTLFLFITSVCVQEIGKEFLSLSGWVVIIAIFSVLVMHIPQLIFLI